MNRRLMMSQQNKGFELVYDAASGNFPETNGEWIWYKGGGLANENKRSLTDGLLNTEVSHLNVYHRYRPAGHLQAKRSEVIIEFESWSKFNWQDSGFYQGCILGVALTDGTYYAACNLTEKQFCVGKVSNRQYVPSSGIWANLKNIDYATPQKFTFRMVFDSGIAYYYINDELLYTQTTLLDESKIEANNTLAVGDMANTIRFGAMSNTYVSKITYKEW